MKKLLLIDGSSLLHRAFFALPLLSNSDGVFTNAIHGFMMMFNRLLAEQKPDFAAVCFDKSRVTFRTQIYSEYKGTRSATPEELKGQFELIKEVLDKAHVRWLEMENYEADDLLGTLSLQGVKAGFEVEIFSGDRDIFQLIDENTKVYMTKKGISDIQCFGIPEILEKYGVSPAQLIDIKGLMGDTSDNIPGVPGVGEKTAQKLISRFGSIDGVYENIDAVDGLKLREKLTLNKDQAYMSRELGTICREVPLEIDWADYQYSPDHDLSELAALYRKLGLRQLERLIPAHKTAPVVNVGQADLPWPDHEAAADDKYALPTADVEEIAAFAASVSDESKIALVGKWNGSSINGKLDLLAVFCENNGLILDLTESAVPLSSVKQLLESENISKICIHAKELTELLAVHDIRLNGVTDDVSLAAYLLDPAEGEHPLPDLLSQYGVPFDNPAAPRDLAAYAAALPGLVSALRKELQDQNMLHLYEDIELPLAFVLADMEMNGIRVDSHQLSAMSEELAEAALSHQKSIFEEAGHEFNLNSPKQLGTVFFEEMGLPALKKTKTGYSTDAEVMETLAVNFPVAQHLIDYRLAAKLRSTYTEGMAKLITADGKLHTTFKQTVTATGRLSSVEPNLQNIPVRQELGRRIRKVFSASTDDRLLIAADYNQIELRILAHISADEKLRDAFIKGEDIHRRTAAEVLGIAPDQITSEQRRAAKAVNFGIVYGISDYGLSKDLGISRKEAADYIALYFQRYPGVEAYQKETIAAAREKGYVETLFGRRRYLPDLNNRNFNLRSFAERMAINAPIQGSAADIIKIAMISLAREMKERQLNSQMLLQVHDELILDMDPSEVDVLPVLVKKNMEQAISLAIPLTVDVKIGSNWYEMKKLEF